MGRQRRLDILFLLVILVAIVFVTVAVARKSGECEARGGNLVIFGRGLVQCVLSDGSSVRL